MPILTASERVGTDVAGRYRLEKILGEGGFSSVFLGKHLVTGRLVALKLLHAHLVQTEQVSQRFLQEAQMMAKIRHPGIVEVLDAGREPDGTVFLALELLEGEGLDAVLSRTTRLSRDETVHIGAEVLDALEAAHGHGIVHRDIKPANIFLAKEPGGPTRSKVLDFGIAQAAEQGGSKLTHQGVILGTPEYMSPEQGRGGAITPAADIWSLGIVLFECLTGVVPWTAENPAAVLHAVQNEVLPEMRSLAADIPLPIASVIRRALSKKPSDRFASAAEMRTALMDAARAGDAWPADSGELSRGGKWSITPAPGPAVKPRAVTGAPPPSESSMRIAAVGMQQGRGREFEMDDPGGLSLDLEVSPEVTSRRTSSSQTMPATRPASMAPPSGAAVSHSIPPPASTVQVNRSPSSSSSSLPAVRPSPSRSPVSPEPALPMPPSHESAAPPPARAPTAAAAAAARSPGANITFSTSPVASRSSLWIGAFVVAVGVAGVVAWRLSHPSATSGVRPGGDLSDSGTRATVPVDAPSGLAGGTSELRQRYAIRVPFGTDRDGALAFARHLSLGPPPAAGSQNRRTIATCIRTHVYLYAGGDGLPTSSASAEIACEQWDLAVIADVDGDGANDVAAVDRARTGVVILSTQQLTPARTIAVDRALGLIAGPIVAGQPTVLVYAEPTSASGTTSVLALGARTGETLWRADARAPLTRMGQPAEQGLSSGYDATGDGVSDVAVGLSAPAGSESTGGPDRPRCVDLLDGTNGQHVWPAPFCMLRGGMQSVALGPDVDGDHRADVAFGSDMARGADPRVGLLSGVDGHLLRRVAVPAGPSASGFGWPVTLDADIDGDRVPDIAVGTLGSTGTFVSVMSGRDGRRIGERSVPGDVGFPNLRIAMGGGLLHGEGVAVVHSSPDDGLVVNVLAGQ